MIIHTNEHVRSKQSILNVLYAKDKNLNVIKIDTIFYPYALLVHRIQMKNPKSTMNRKLLCVMDMATGRGAIGNQDPQLTEIEVDEVQVVDPQLDEKTLRSKAHDFVFKTVMSKVRVLYVPAIILERTEFFHKMFYVIQCRDPQGKDYFLLADAIDASYTVLDY